MNRKYLEDIGVVDRPDTWEGTDEEQALWKEQRDVYGFDEREIFCLMNSFYLWLYERLKMYVEHNREELESDTREFDFNGFQFTQLELIKLMFEEMEYYFHHESDTFFEDQLEYIGEIERIWVLLIEIMWGEWNPFYKGEKE